MTTLRCDKRIAYLDDYPTRNLEPTKLEPLLLCVGPFGPLGAFLGFKENTHILYLCESSEAKERTRKSAMTDDFAIYPNRRALGGPGTISLFWSRRAKTKGIIAAVQFFTQEDTLVVTHMSIRPKWRRNRLIMLMIRYLMDDYETTRVEFVEPTEDGEKFAKSFVSPV